MPIGLTTPVIPSTTVTSTNITVYDSPLDNLAEVQANPVIEVDKTPLVPHWQTMVSNDNYWNKNLPYQLLLLRATANKDTGTIGYSIVNGGTFTLPINPQSLSIDTPFAINMAVTQGGVVEQHNGTPIRTISLSGTTGVFPYRDTGTQLKLADALTGMAAGGVGRPIITGSISGIATDLARAGTAVQNIKKGSNDNLMPQLQQLSATDNKDIAKTGYGQFMRLQHFLESYAKRKAQGETDLRLAFAVWKDSDQVYLVTPQTFRLSRSANSPFTYNYTLNLKAWGRVSVDNIITNTNIKKAEDWSAISNRLFAARELIRSGASLLSGVRPNSTDIGETVRLMVAAIKQKTASDFCVSDLPFDWYQKTAKKDLESFSATNSSAFTATETSALRSYLGIDPNPKPRFGGKASQYRNQDPLPNNKQPDLIPPDVLDKISLSDVVLSPSARAQAQAEKNKVTNLTENNYREMRAQLVDFIADFSTAVGAGDATYDTTYGRSSSLITPIKSTPDVDDYELMGALNETLIILDKLILDKTSEVQTVVTSIEYIGGLARQSGIAFTSPVSKFAIPFPYGVTLEQLSAQYLGTPDRWHEIAALNGLRAPYVDEEGFDLLLVTNGKDDQVVVPYSSDLFVGQSVWISSTTVARTKRTIEKLERVGNNLVVTVNGDANMNLYSVMATATLHAYLPDTICSQQLIYIPSNQTAQEDAFQLDRLPSIDDSTAFLKVGGIDLTLKSNMDLAINSSGDCPFSVGLNNVIQKLRIGLATPVGSLLHHPEYGVGLPLGESTADVDMERLRDSISALISSDSSISGINGLALTKEGPGLTIAASINLAGVSANIPVVTTVKL